MKKAMTKCVFHILLLVLIVLSLAVAVVGEALYIPFIPVVLYLHKHNEKFRHVWNREIQHSVGFAYIVDVIFAGSYFGLFFALNFACALSGIGIPFCHGP